MARNETEQVRQLQRTLYRTAKQSKAVKFYRLAFDEVGAATCSGRHGDR